MRTPVRRKVALIATGAAVTGLALSGCRAAVPPTDPTTPADFTVTSIATIPGAAFTVAGELAGGPSSQEIVTSSFNFQYGAGPPIPKPGAVTLIRKVDGAWTTSSIVTAAEGIIGPNKPTITDVNGDGRNDVIVPAGYFFSAISGPPGVGLPSGSITWWENTTTSFVRHDVVTGKVGSYHSAVHTDVDGDGKKDLLTTFEDGGFPAWPFGSVPVAPTVRIEYFKGLGGGSFGAPVKLADGGGSLPVVADINLDGKPDIATAQYFKVKSAPIPPFNITDESFVWFERTGSAADGLDASDFTKHVIATGLGESFQLLAVDNIDGDGKYAAIGVNHTNPALGPSAAPQVVRLDPGSDPTLPWTVTPVASGFTPDDNRAGQAAPGSTSDGDLDGDGDVDLAVAGDSDFSIYWVERTADGGWVKHDIAEEYGTPGSNWGQGSTTIADVDRNLRNDLVFSSFNAGQVFLVERVAGTGGKFPATPRVPDPLVRY
jgi:hypothetical protein